MGDSPYGAVDDDKPLYFMGTSKDDLSAFPDEVKLVIGFALRMAQRGEKHAQAKPWKGDGSGVLEIVEDDGDAYRASCTPSTHFKRSPRRALRRVPGT